MPHVHKDQIELPEELLDLRAVAEGLPLEAQLKAVRLRRPRTTQESQGL
jgi:hypothetical protein